MTSTYSLSTPEKNPTRHKSIFRDRRKWLRSWEVTGVCFAGKAGDQGEERTCESRRLQTWREDSCSNLTGKRNTVMLAMCVWVEGVKRWAGLPVTPGPYTKAWKIFLSLRETQISLIGDLQTLEDTHSKRAATHSPSAELHSSQHGRRQRPPTQVPLIPSYPTSGPDATFREGAASLPKILAPCWL